jgi:Signal transduction histidine kinase
VKALEAIERNGRHLLVMINDILDLSKIEANKLDLQIVETDLVALCRDVVSQLAPAAEDKGLRMGISVGSLTSVETDPARVTQILLNLISNAIKYTECGSVSVEVSTTSDGTAAEIQVVDTGVGISPADQKRLFKRFEQFDDNSRFKVGKGTGLGLSIASNLAHLLGASIYVESELGSGSQFVLTIPFCFKGSAVNQDKVVAASNQE